MQCFLCMTYVMFICSAHPGLNRDQPRQQRSLFHDVIESIRIRTQTRDDYIQNNENNLAQNFDSYGYENKPPRMPGDTNFIPRRNDRIEMPSLKYRVPKSLKTNYSIDSEPQQEVIVYINTSTQKPKKKTSKPTTQKIKPMGIDETNTDLSQPLDTPWANTMAGQSQIGNRESQMVVKPTVIVNIRGTVSQTDGEIRIKGRNTNETESKPTPAIFNINQEIKVQRNFERQNNKGDGKSKVKQEVRILSEKVKSDLQDDMEMCETSLKSQEINRESRNYDNVLQIMFSLPMH